MHSLNVIEWQNFFFSVEICSAIMCISAVGLLLVGIYLSNHNTFVEESNHVNESTLQVYKKVVQHNLPESTDPFFGRVDDLVKLENLIISSAARIVNINGPPAFGKSTLAIKLGKELLIKYSESIHTVRYVDTETTRPLWYLCTESEEDITRTSLIANRSLITTDDADLPHYDSNNDLCFCQWLKATKERVVLILDNCEHILRGKNRKHFLDVIHDCCSSQKTNAVIIVVSQEQLLMTDYGFFSFHVKELSLLDSRALLKHYVPNLSDEKADELSTAVGQCPLALKVTGKLLQLKGIDYLKILMKDLREKSVQTLSRGVSRDKESFRTIMDAAYSNLEHETKLCSQFLSLFSGSTGYEMEKLIMKAVVNVSCIEDVVRNSFIEEILVGDEIRHSMHKLIRDYLREKHSLEFDKHDYNMRFFNESFVTYYSKYLIQTMKHLYGSGNEPLSDKESYTLNYLEIHNIEHFAKVATAIASSTVRMKTDTAIAFGLIIEENLMGSITEKILFRLYRLYSDRQVFSKLCATSSEVVCASILWKTFISVADPECIGSPSAPEKDKCSKYFDCSDLNPFNSGRTFTLIQEQVKKKSSGNREKIILDKVDQTIYTCEATKILGKIWHSILTAITAVLKFLNSLFSVLHNMLILILYVIGLPLYFLFHLLNSIKVLISELLSPVVLLILEQIMPILVFIRNIAIGAFRYFVVYVFSPSYGFFNKIYLFLVSCVIFVVVIALVFGLFSLCAFFQQKRRPHHHEKDKKKRKKKILKSSSKKERDSDGSEQGPARRWINLWSTNLVILTLMLLCTPLFYYQFSDVVYHYSAKFLVHLFPIDGSGISSEKAMSKF